MNILFTENIIVVLPIIIIFITFCCIIYLPQQAYRARTAMVVGALKPGVTVTTANGTRGTVVYVLAHTLIVLTDDGQKIEVLTHGVTNVQL